MHPDNLWSDEDILPTVDPALLAAIEDGFPHSHSHTIHGIVQQQPMQCIIPSLLEYLHLTPTIFYI